MLEVLERDVGRLGELLGRPAAVTRPSEREPIVVERPVAREPAQLGLF